MSGCVCFHIHILSYQPVDVSDAYKSLKVFFALEVITNLIFKISKEKGLLSSRKTLKPSQR